MSDTDDTNTNTNETTGGRLNRVRVVQETSRVYPHVLEAYHGENVRIEVDFRNYGVPVDLTGGTAGLYYRGESDPEGYYHFTSLQVDPDEPSVVVVDWGPSIDGGDPEVEWYVSVSVGTPPTTSFHGAGTLKLKASPGFDPAVLPPATTTLDFDAVTVLHAPYYTKTETDTALAGKYDKSGGEIAGDVGIAGSLQMTGQGGMVSNAGGYSTQNVKFIGMRFTVATDTQRNIDLPAQKGGIIALTSDIPAQVNADWNASSGAAQILNKPNIIPVTIDSYQGVYKTTTDVQQLVVANSDQSKFAYLFAPQGASDTRQAYIGTNGTVQAAKLQTSSGVNPNPLAIPAGATANDAIARTSDLPLFESWTFTLNDSTTVTKKVAIYS